MATLNLPFKGDTIKSLYENIMSKKIEPIPDFYSEDLKKIINYMLIFDPSKGLLQIYCSATLELRKNQKN